jgi:hypothetical protein
MSRSKKSKNGKGPGYEYWSKRPMSGSPPGRWAKKKTHRLERIEAKKIIKKESEEDDGDIS